jgi:hypothetical protein
MSAGAADVALSAIITSVMLPVHRPREVGFAFPSTLNWK